MLDALKCLALLTALGWVANRSFADEPAGEPSDAQQGCLSWIDQNAELLCDVNHRIWSFAEVGLREYKSSAALIDELDKAGFKVESGVAGMPTAFVASYGSGKPVIGILAEYDALPELSQKIAAHQESVVAGAAGHGCGHSAFGAGSLGAAMAAQASMEKHHLSGTIRLYGCPAEETLIGKVYMKLAGHFDDLDVCLHWHPSDKTVSQGGSSKAMVSVKFNFHGVASHGSTNPHFGRSALDAVELMNVGANYMREHVKEDARMHYVITNGGGQPNVVPPTATVWYFVRADSHDDVEKNFAWLRQIAQGAALMTQTTMTETIDTDCHEIIPNMPLARLIHDNLAMVGAPRFMDSDRQLAARLQTTFSEPPNAMTPPLDETVQSITLAPAKGSTDVGDISWAVPTGGLRAACFPIGSPSHSWQNVASIGSPIGEQGLIVAAKALSITAIELLERPELLDEIKNDHRSRMKDRTYTTLIPEQQKAPESIR